MVDATTGHNSEPLELALQLVRDGGTVVIQNTYEPSVVLPTPLRSVFRRSIRLAGSFSYCRHDTPDDHAEGVTVLQGLRGLPDQLTRERRPLEGLPEALGFLLHANATKAVLWLPAAS